MGIFKFLSHLKQDITLSRKTKKFSDTLNSIVSPNLNIENNREIVHFKHSGHLGDIIYAIPAMFALAKNKKIAIHLNTNAISKMRKKMNHPNGNKMITDSNLEILKPLLLYQKQIEICDKFNNQHIDYDLDLFRQYPFDFRMGSISRWYFLTFAVNYNLSKPWLFTTTNNIYNNYIIIARSKRYRTPNINYSFLSKFSKIGFVGLKDEYEDMNLIIPNLEFFQVNNFLELAEIINSCKLFIGNQSSPFAIAEALKVKRVLEVYPFCPNVIVEGDNCFDFCYQYQFEIIVNNLLHS